MTVLIYFLLLFFGQLTPYAGIHLESMSTSAFPVVEPYTIIKVFKDESHAVPYLNNNLHKLLSNHTLKYGFQIAKFKIAGISEYSILCGSYAHDHSKIG